MNDIAKILGWTIGAVLVVHLATSSAGPAVVKNVTSAWTGIVGTITGGSNGTS